MNAKRTVFDGLVGQPRVRTFLTNAASSGRLSHAYLFVGPPGSGKLDAAKAVAASAVCGQAGCTGCDDCRRVLRGAHPDVRYYEPEGAQYLVEQVRDIVHDVSLAPIRSARKVYVVQRADLLGDAAANAFLKTLEEPPADVMIVLLARSLGTVIPTIVSRCQVVPFRRVPSSESEAILVSLTGARVEDARGALAATGGVVAKARDLLMSPERQTRRTRMLRTLADLGGMDDLDVLRAAAGLRDEAEGALGELQASHKAEQVENAEFLTKGALTKLEKRQTRELSARKREGYSELFSVTRSWVRDALVLSHGREELVMNPDAVDSSQALADMLTDPAAARALAAVDRASRRISYNVTPLLAVEAMLYDIREVLRCPR